MNSSVVMAIMDGVVSRGIAALRFNFRGVGGSEGAHDKGMGEREDVLAALKRLSEEKEIAKERIGLAGYSFGTGVAIAVAPKEPLVQCIVLVAPLLAGVNTPAALAYGKPKLLIAGDMDSYVPVEQVHELSRKRMAQPLQIEVVHGADHFFFGHEQEIANLAGDFFKRRL
jgi:alpha/beta superfamily hydrolase